MSHHDDIQLTQKALKLIDDIEDASKEEGLVLINDILGKKNRKLAELGYDHVILKALIRIVQFESAKPLKMTLGILQKHYFVQVQHQDELAETLLYRVAMSNDIDVCQPVLENILILIDHMEGNIAKHSKQLIKLADINNLSGLNNVISEILNKMKQYLPKRKVIN